FSALYFYFFFFSSRRRHTRFSRDWSSDVCSSDLSSAALTIDGIVDSAALRAPTAAKEPPDAAIRTNRVQAACAPPSPPPVAGAAAQRNPQAPSPARPSMSR